MSAQETPPVDELFADLDTPDIDAELFRDVEQGVDREGRWRIDDLSKAQWAMAKLKEAQERVAELTAQRDAQMELAQAWFARVVQHPRRTVGFMQAQLVDYALREREFSNVLTTVLPNGEIATRKGAEPCVEIDDEEALLAWAKQNAPAIVTVKESVKVTDLRHVVVIANGKVLSPDGEVVPGAEVRPAGEAYVPNGGIKPY
jgi:Bacteriophage Mu Gam like protein